MSTVVNAEKFYERLNRIHAHFVKHRYVDVVGTSVGILIVTINTGVA
jgi:hypothetical protein